MEIERAGKPFFDLEEVVTQVGRSDFGTGKVVPLEKIIEKLNVEDEERRQYVEEIYLKVWALEGLGYTGYEIVKGLLYKETARGSGKVNKSRLVELIDSMLGGMVKEEVSRLAQIGQGMAEKRNIKIVGIIRDETEKIASGLTEPGDRIRMRSG